MEELRADPTPLTKLDIKTILEHSEAIVRALDAPPIIMGHSFGGLFAQLLAYRGLGSAVVGIEPGAPVGGHASAAIKVMLRRRSEDDGARCGGAAVTRAFEYVAERRGVAR